MVDLLSSPIEHEDTQRLGNRTIKHNQEKFPDDPSVEPTNNRVEGQLRPMVIMRKLMFGNRSDSGATNQAAIMNIVETDALNSEKPLTSFVQLPKARHP